MTSFQHSAAAAGPAAATPRIFGSHATELSPEQMESWRARIQDCEHPVLLLDSQFKPLLRNQALRTRLSEPSTAAGTNQPMAFIWQTICDTASRIVAQHAQNDKPSEIAEAFPVNQRCFMAIGSLLRNESGSVIGAVINFADVSPAQKHLSDGLLNNPSASADGRETHDHQDSYQKWIVQRELALKKMAKLSRREAQVVALVSDGLPNKSIAHELDISVKTIEKHRANATRKLGISSTAEMVRIAVIAGNKSVTAERPPAQASYAPRTTSF